MWEGDNFLKYLVLNNGTMYFELLCVQTDQILDVIWWCNKLQQYLHSIGSSVPHVASLPLSLHSPSFRLTIKDVIVGPTPFNIDNFYAFVRKADDGRHKKVASSFQGIELDEKCETDI